jgi:hypothetical protein
MMVINLMGLIGIILGSIFLVIILISQVVFLFRNRTKLGIDSAPQDLKEYCSNKNNFGWRKINFSSLYYVEHKSSFDIFEKKKDHFYHIKNLSKKKLTV